MSTSIFDFKPSVFKPQHDSPSQKASTKPYISGAAHTEDYNIERRSAMMEADNSKNTTPQRTLPTLLPNAEHRFVNGDPDLKPSYRFNEENAVTLLVGPEKKSMVVHVSYLTRTSEFFTAALKAVWIEGQTRTIDLGDKSLELMAHYLDWMYSTDLPTKGCRLFDAESSKM